MHLVWDGKTGQAGQIQVWTSLADQRSEDFSDQRKARVMDPMRALKTVWRILTNLTNTDGAGWSDAVS